MTVIETILLGVVQGVAEFLPISSSGHLVLVQHFLGWQEPNIMLDVFLHTGTLLAVLIFFAKQIIKLTKQEVLVLVVASIPAGIVGLFFSDAIESLFGSLYVVGAALVLTGIFNLLTDRSLSQADRLLPQADQSLSQDDSSVLPADPSSGDESSMSMQKAIVVGLFQALAIIPGISRSGSTVFAGVMQKVDRVKAFQFSFLLSLPAVGGATLLQLIKVVQTGITFAPVPLFSGFIAAFLAGFVSLLLFQYVIEKSKFEIFGYYCLAVGFVTVLIA